MKQTFRTFWTGPLSPYRALCFRSFLHHGHEIEVFSYDEGLAVPDGVRLRDAREILPRDEVLRYDGNRSFGSGSPALHSDLFRYALLDKLGGWWADADLLLLRSDVPEGRLFIANESAYLLGSAALHSPEPGHPLFRAALKVAADARSDTPWGEIGPILLTRLVVELGLELQVAARTTAFEISFQEAWKLFLPAWRAEAQRRLRFSTFCHLWDASWRAGRIDEQMAPPRGSFLDGQCRKLGLMSLFSGRMEIDSLRTLSGFEAVPSGRAKPFAAMEGFRGAVLNASLALGEDAGEALPPPDEIRKHLSALWSAAERVEEAAEAMAAEVVALRARRNLLAEGRAAQQPKPGARSVAAEAKAGDPAPAARHVFQCFWHGSPLSPYERLSMASLLARGHRVVLYRYDAAVEAPPGVEIADARDFLPTEAVITHAEGRGQGSYALHADILRMLLMEATGDWWIDLDMILLAEALPSDPTVLFWHCHPDQVNAAVARMPAGSPLLQDLLSSIDLATVAEVEWGGINPVLFTEMVRAYGLTGLARPAQQAFPVGYWEFEKLLLPSAREEAEESCRDSLFVHFWHDRLRRSGVPKWIAPPAGSYLDIQFRRFDVSFPPGPSLPAEQITRWSANLRLLDEERARSTSKDHEAQNLRREIAALNSRLGMIEAERSALARSQPLGPDLSKPGALRLTP